MTRLARLSAPALALALLAAGTAPAAGQKSLSDLLPATVVADLPAAIATDDDATAFRVGADLARLAAEHAAHRRSRAAQPFVPSNPLVRLRGDRVLIDAVADGDAELLRTALVEAGLENGAGYGRVISGYLPIAAIARLPRLAGLRFARPSHAATGVGSVDSQGDT